MTAHTAYAIATGALFAVILATVGYVFGWAAGVIRARFFGVKS